jgi:type III secretory pathway component EscV
VIGRVTVLVLATIAAVTVGLVDSMPLWKLIVLACLAWAVLIVFVLRGERVHE